MKNTHAVHARSPGCHGAESLKNGLARDLWVEEKNILIKKVEFWQDAVSGRYKKMNLEKRDREQSEAIYRWYWKEIQDHSYQAASWKISPERSLLFQEFRSDPNYHLKNLVEVVGRQLMEEIFRARGLNPNVMLTSDSDDVFSWVDLIVELRTKGKPVEYTGIDIAISKNPYYLAKKEKRTETICYEFNAFKGYKNKSMPREVFAIPPRVMAKFLTRYMQQISLYGAIKPHEVLNFFREARTRSVATVRLQTQSKVHKAISN